MDIESSQTQESFGKSMAKLFATTTVSSAAVWTGLGVAIFAIGQALEIKKRHAAKNLPKN